MLHLQHNFGVEFNRFGDGVTISRPWQQRAENQQVPSPLQQLDALVVDILGEVIVRPVECQGERYLALPQYLGALAEYSCDYQFRCGCRGPWRNLFEGDELSCTQKLT